MNQVQFRVLYRQFLFRMVDLELLSTAARRGYSTTAGAFHVASDDCERVAGRRRAAVRAARHLKPHGAFDHLWGEEHFLIATTILVGSGLFAVISWDSMFPDQRDVLVLAPLPVRPETLLFAKIAAVAGALGLSIFVLNAVSGLATPIAFGAVPRVTSLFDAASVLNGLPGAHPVNPVSGQCRSFAVCPGSRWRPRAYLPSVAW